MSVCDRQSGARGIVEIVKDIGRERDRGQRHHVTILVFCTRDGLGPEQVVNIKV